MREITKKFWLLLLVFFLGSLSLFLFLKNLFLSTLLQDVSSSDFLSISTEILHDQNVTRSSYIAIYPSEDASDSSTILEEKALPLETLLDPNILHLPKLPQSNAYFAQERPSFSKQADVDLYYVRIDSEGLLVLDTFPQKIAYEESLIKRSLETLLLPLEVNALQKGYLNLIPPQTQVLNLYQEGKTLIVDLSKDFLQNSLGAEGYVYQLKQLIYTATSFPGIDSVLVLIDGQEYGNISGSTGLSLEKPLRRNDLNLF